MSVGSGYTPTRWCRNPACHRPINPDLPRCPHCQHPQGAPK